MGGHFLFDVDNAVTLNDIDFKMTLTFEQASVECMCYQWWIRDFPAGGYQRQKGIHQPIIWQNTNYSQKFPKTT